MGGRARTSTPARGWLGDASQCESQSALSGWLWPIDCRPPQTNGRRGPSGRPRYCMIWLVGSLAYEDWPDRGDERRPKRLKQPITRLAHLDRLGNPCTPVTARQALEAELSVPVSADVPVRAGHLGHTGIGLVGLSRKCSMSSGMHDGAFPGSARRRRPRSRTGSGKRSHGSAPLPLRGSGSAEARTRLPGGVGGRPAYGCSRSPGGTNATAGSCDPRAGCWTHWAKWSSPPRRLFSRDVAALPPLAGFREEPSVHFGRAIAGSSDRSDGSGHSEPPALGGIWTGPDPARALRPRRSVVSRCGSGARTTGRIYAIQRQRRGRRIRHRSCTKRPVGHPTGAVLKMSPPVFLRVGAPRRAPTDGRAPTGGGPCGTGHAAAPDSRAFCQTGGGDGGRRRRPKRICAWKSCSPSPRLRSRRSSAMDCPGLVPPGAWSAPASLRCPPGLCRRRAGVAG